MKYIDADKLIANLMRQKRELVLSIQSQGDFGQSCQIIAYENILALITSLQQEQSMPDSTKLIELWHQDKEMLKEKDFRDDPWRLAYNAYMCGFGRGIAVNKQVQPKFNVGDLIVSKKNPHLTYKILATNIPNELGKTDYKVEIFTDGKPGLLGKPHNIRLISSDKIEDWGELVQQEQPETEMKSPFTGGKVAILSREEEVTFRQEKVKILRKYYRCEDTGREFTDSKLDDDMMWAAFRAYCEKKGMTSFTDIMLKQEQPEVNLEGELDKYLRGEFQQTAGGNFNNYIQVARHFYELGLNARKGEAK